MGVFDLYSKRQAVLRGDKNDLYVYDSIPETVRVQLWHITNNKYINGPGAGNHIYRANQLVGILRQEYGVLNLAVGSPASSSDEIKFFLLHETNAERILDFVEVLIYSMYELSSINPRESIDEINNRLKWAQVGYCYTNGKIIRIDSTLVHSEIVIPALTLIHEPGYQGANNEFLIAHEHYRHGRLKEAITAAAKSLESTAKAICEKRGWQYGTNKDTMVPLINTVTEKLEIPPYLQSLFESVRTSLRNGVGTIRNREGGHGQGPEIKDVEHHLAAYTLHLTASAIIFLIEAEKALP